MAKIEYLNDLPVKEEKVECIENMFQRARELVVEKLKDGNKQHVMMTTVAKADVEQKFGKMPTTSALDFSWWLSAVLPLDTAVIHRLEHI